MELFLSCALEGSVSFLKESASFLEESVRKPSKGMKVLFWQTQTWLTHLLRLPEDYVAECGSVQQDVDTLLKHE